MVKLRVEGLPEDVAATVQWLRASFVVVDESPAYPNRAPSKLIRKYITIKAEPPPERGDQPRV